MKFPGKHKIEQYGEGKKQAVEFYDNEEVDVWLKELRKQLEQIIKFNEDWLKLSGVESSRAYGKAQLARQILEEWLPYDEIQKKGIKCNESDWTNLEGAPAVEMPTNISVMKIMKAIGQESIATCVVGSLMKTISMLSL
jgi:hypothetical protein